MATAISEDTEDVYIGGVKDAIDYILEKIDKDSDYIYPEKEVIKLFFQFENFKYIPVRDLQNLINIIQKQKK